MNSEKLKISWDDVNQTKVKEKVQQPEIRAKKQIALQNFSSNNASKINNFSSVVLGIAIFIGLGIMLVWFSSSKEASIEKKIPKEEKTAEKIWEQAISKVMDQDIELKKELQSISKDNSPSQVAGIIERYCHSLQKLDIADCPAKFKVALRHYINALKNFVEELQKLPNDPVEAVVMGFFNGLFRGEVDGGLGRLENNFKQAFSKVTTTWEELERVAAQYGVAK